MNIKFEVLVSGDEFNCKCKNTNTMMLQFLDSAREKDIKKKAFMGSSGTDAMELMMGPNLTRLQKETHSIPQSPFIPHSLVQFKENSKTDRLILLVFSDGHATK